VEVDEIRYIETIPDIPAQYIAQVKAIDPDTAVPEDTVEPDGKPFSRISCIYPEMLSVPPDTVLRV
jgi:hypothetical protein